VDRQRNDRLGRRCWRVPAPACQHRRQILRCCTGSDTYANTFSDSNRDSYSDGNSNSDAYGNFDPMHREMFTHAAAAPDAGTSTLEVRK
jgi:hypothetical protein